MKGYSKGYSSVSTASRLRPVILIVLVLAAAFGIFKLAGVGGINEGNFEAQRNSELRGEMQLAVSNVNSLSRLGSSSTSSMLGRIRQHVHGVEVINELNVGMYGEVGRLYPQSMFDDIYTIIEEYEARLSSGQKVSETLNALSEAVNALNERTYQILGVELTDGN
ncbi:MAG: hypothetical protein IKK75_12320 [Clostridia bacterium]|nr:hypothetical protein [Clostridia bacterium]